MKFLSLLVLAVTVQLTRAAPFFDPTVPVHGSPVDAGLGGQVARGLLLNVGDGKWVVFDQDLLRPVIAIEPAKGESPMSLALMAQASWEKPTQKGGVKLPAPAAGGTVLCPPLPGVAADLQGLEADPRPSFGGDTGRGGLEASGRRFLGYLAAGDTGVLSYCCGKTEIREWYAVDRGHLIRNLAVAPGPELLFLLPDSGSFVEVGKNHPGLKVETKGALRFARLAASENERRVSLTYGGGDSSAKTPAPPGAAPARWRRGINTAIEDNERSGPGWAMDRVALPLDNPWKRRVRPADMVFLAANTAALVTFGGDVWRLDLAGKRCRWTRIAAGLCEPLSIEQVNGVLQVFTRNGIVRLHDRNGDGETDFYENHSSLVMQTAGTRGYPLDMEVDETGRTWCSIGGIATDGRSINNKRPANSHSGAILTISPDGKELEVVAAHAREPFFARDGKSGRIAMSDQQGNWVPSSGIFPVTAGADFGYGSDGEAGLVAPAVWIPHDQDTSSASPLWLRGTAFKDWNGGLLDLSYGTGRVLLVRPGGEWPSTGGAVIPLSIDTGLPILHARTHPADGSIWLAGFRIYDSRAPALEGVARLRPTGDALATAVDATVVKEGVILRFGAGLDPASVTAEAVAAKEWQYRRSSGYGSPRLKRDGSQGVDPLATGGCFLSKDGKGAFIHIPGLKPTMQLEISHRFHIKGTASSSQSVFFTVGDPPAADWDAMGFEPPVLDEGLATVHDGSQGNGVPTLEQGRELSARFGCIACHSLDGAKEGHSGPTWKGLYRTERHFAEGDPRTADDAYLIESMMEPGKAIVKGYALGMGSYAGVLSETEMQSIVLFIRSLK
ncbi:c-type cytochrome [Luteolibacter marinus]|uniref:c-type cytochrome n=1 Tax=Luteolibacter marinus TaxID=2776705 RepID=UPI00186730D3|nr:cytochrome c [Luteolibacter marinus]